MTRRSTRHHLIVAGIIRPASSAVTINPTSTLRIDPRAMEARRGEFARQHPQAARRQS